MRTLFTQWGSFIRYEFVNPFRANIRYLFPSKPLDWQIQGVCTVWKVSVFGVSTFFNFQTLNGSNFWTTCLIWMNNPSLKSYYAFVFKRTSSCDIFADASSFSLIWGKVRYVTSFNPILRHIARCFLKKDWKCLEYVGTSPDSFSCRVSYGNQIKKRFFLNYH